MESSRKPLKEHGKAGDTDGGDYACKLRTTKRPNKLQETDSETQGSNKIQKTKHACIVEAHESTRKRLESTPPKDHEDHIAEKWFNSSSHCNLVHKFIPMPQAMKIRDAKAAVDKEWEKLEHCKHGKYQGKEQKGGHPRSTKKTKNSPFLLR